MLNGNKFTEKDEQNLAIDGSKRTYPFYVVGIPMKYEIRSKRKITVYVDNKLFTNVLNNAFKSRKNINVINKSVDLPLIEALLQKSPIICHLDDHCLGDYSHASHFVILEKATENFISIVDPWSGTRRRLRKQKILEGIKDLKSIVKMCPLLFTFGGVETLQEHRPVVRV